MDEYMKLEMLATLHRSDRPMDPNELTEFGPFEELISALEELHAKKLIDIAKPLYGDNRLMSARGIALSFKGSQTVQGAIRNGFDILKTCSLEAALNSPPVTDSGAIEQKRQHRAAFMNQLYQMTSGSPATQLDPLDIGVVLEWPPSHTSEVVRYLFDEGLVDRAWRAVMITHMGIVEVEELLANPDSQTRHFNPVTNIYVYGNNQGQIQAATIGSNQTQSLQDPAPIERFLNVLESALAAARQDAATIALVHANVEDVRAAIRAEGPASPRVRRLMPYLKDFGVNLAASGAFEGLSEAAANLPTFL